MNQGCDQKLCAELVTALRKVVEEVDPTTPRKVFTYAGACESAKAIALAAIAKAQAAR